MIQEQPKQTLQSQVQNSQKKHQLLGIAGCIGGGIIHLVIGSLFQWGIINVYITSYYRLTDSSVSLESNAIVFPLMMMSIGPGMKLGLFLSEKSHPLIVLYMNQILFGLFIFVASWMPTFAGFIIFYGILFGFVAGLTFMIPIYQCNKFLPNQKMTVIGIILTGTGVGAILFGLFSYNFLNPQKIRPIKGYYIGSPQLQNISAKVPECIRFLSLLYLILGFLGTTILIPICKANRIKQNLFDEKLKNQSNENVQIQIQIKGQPTNWKEAFCHSLWWIKVGIIITSSCGAFLMNGNFKTYVKQQIDDDQFLTIIGVVGSIGNGVPRFLWNLLFSKTGYKTMMLIFSTINIIVFSTIRFTVFSKQLYLVYIFVINCNFGGILVVTATFVQTLYGPKFGSNVYGFFWCILATSNFIAYIYVAFLSKVIGFDNVIYIVLAMSILAIPLIILNKFQGPWQNNIQHLQYCSCYSDNRKVQNEDISIENLNKDKINQQQKYEE